MFPQSFKMRHYIFLSVANAIRKYINRNYSPKEVEEKGWSRWRATLKPEMIELPAQSELRTYVSDEYLDASNPRTQNYLAELVLKSQEAGK